MYIYDAGLKILSIFIYKKLIIFAPLFFVLLFRPIFAEQLLIKSDVLRKSNQCFKDFQYEVCSNLLMEFERIQLVEKEKSRYKCQTSILGLQTEIIEAYYLKKSNKNQNGIMIPYVIKNC